MSIFKCKICGGTLEINSGETVATCEYCGTKQTLPKLDDEKKANLFDRANHFRRNNDFDKAMGIYEQILNEDTEDAECYWSIVLCRYGIEYVEDPYSRKRVPTVNRAQFTSVFDDEDYKSAIKYADAHQRELYEKEATTINEIQKSILAISGQEEPFDVFICYKETDANGRRTQDSVLATELYHELTREGYKVFFSRITLEDKLGTAYEPYIFAALNSSKVMVVLGTKPEHFNAVWVRNEWSRYLALIKQGQKKMLIPAFRDMDPYDLPEEFSHLQAQDMSKLGFMQDLVRGITKLVIINKSQSTITKEPVVQNTVSNITPLLERGFMALEDGEWKKADDFFEQVLNFDAKFAGAYLGKLMVDLRVKKQEELKNCEKSFVNNNNYQKLSRFADVKLKSVLAGYIDYINVRNENIRVDVMYNQATSSMKKAKNENEWKVAANMFENIRSYKNSEELRSECLKNAETEHFERERRAEIACRKKELYVKFLKRIIIIVAMFVFIITTYIIVHNEVIVPKSKYNNAILLMEDGKYTEAITVFEAMDGYKDSLKKIDECNTAILDNKYNKAIALFEDGNYTNAISEFKELEGYRDSVRKIEECNTAILDVKYNDSILLIEEGKIVEAYEALDALDGYKDSAEKASSIHLKYEVEKLKSAKVGDKVLFGTYEQDNNISNGQEEIEWIVLDNKNDKFFVISNYSLDCQLYNTTKISVTWETCSLREWLNNDFVNVAFSDDEKALIPMVTVSADKNPSYSTAPGRTTHDRIFLLSIDEFDKYLRSQNKESLPTSYAVENGAGKATRCWWLRTPGTTKSEAAIVYLSGSIVMDGRDVNYSFGVRPAMWIDISGIEY